MKKNKQLGEVRLGDPFHGRCGTITLIYITFMLLLGIYQTFMHFHLEMGVLVASSVFTDAATLLADPRYINISFHFSFMIKRG